METSVPQGTLRKAEEADCATVKSIAQDAYAMYLDRMDVKPFPMLDDYLAHIRQERVYILEDGALVRGYVVLIQEDADTFLLDNIAVRPENRKMGYGRTLARFAEEQGRQAGCKRIHLYTNEVMTENVRWYTQLGYSIESRVVENGYRRIYMTKDLTKELT